MRIEWVLEGITGFTPAYRGCWTLYNGNEEQARGRTEWTEDQDALSDMVLDAVEYETGMKQHSDNLERKN